VFHPGVLISSLDRKEAEYFNACHAALTNYLYPKCLVHHCELQCLTKKSEPRTMAMMKAVVDEALNAHTKMEKEDLLKNHGLHGIKVCQDIWPFTD
jgi:hypothetical protein